MAGKIRVLVYSSCAAVTAGIASTLHDDAVGGLVLARVHNYSDLAERASEFAAEVAVLHDLGHRQVASWGNRRSAVVLAVGDEYRGADILHALRAGIVAVVSVDTDLSALGQACRDAAAGTPYLSPRLVRALIAHILGREGAQPPTLLALTPRETQVLRHLAGGRSQSDISAVMRISRRTVKHHLGNVYRKLGVRGQREAIVLAYREGLVA